MAFDPLRVGGVVMVADLQQHRRSLGTAHLAQGGGGSGGHLVGQGIDLPQSRRKQLRRPPAVCAAGIIKGDDPPVLSLAARAGGVGVKREVKVIVPRIALPDSVGGGALGVVAAVLDAVGQQQRLHGIRQEIHEVFLAARAGDILVIFLCGGA